MEVVATAAAMVAVAMAVGVMVAAGTGAAVMVEAAMEVMEMYAQIGRAYISIN